MSTTVPTSPTDERWPVWTDFQDNWRAVDAHWIRARVVNVFDNLAARTTALTSVTPLVGALSYLQNIDSLEMYKSTGAWESVRYPNLSVTGTTALTLRQVSAGSGIILQNDGYAAIEKLNAGLGVMLVGTAGVSVKTGARTVLLATDATQLTIDSPVKVTGALTATGALSGTSLALTAAVTGVTNITATGTIQGASVIGTTDVRGASVYGSGVAQLTVNGGYASFQHNTAPTYGFRVGSDGNTIISGGGQGNTVYGTTNHTGALSVGGNLTLTSGTSLNPAGTSAVPLAGIIVVNGRGPVAGDNQPNGTIWIQV
jgi:hypothetical protein